MKSSDIALILVALISLVATFLTARSAKNAAKYSTDATITGERIKAEAEAYTRSRDTYLATIKHQDTEIAELRAEVREVRTDNRRLQEENTELRRRVENLERQGDPNG